MDEVDPTEEERVTKQTLLGGVPDSFADKVTDFDVDERAARPKLALLHGRRAKKDTAADLWELTKDLKEMQGRLTKSMQSEAEEEQEETDVDPLFKAASILMKLNKASNESDDNKPPVPAPIPADRWKKLQTNLGAAVSGRDTMNTDEIEDPRTGEGRKGDGYPADEEHGKDRGAAVRRLSGKIRANYKAVTSYKELEDWIRVKKLGIFAYVKILLFAIIIPAAGISALLFYGLGNPPCSNTVCQPKVNLNNTAVQVFGTASTSWWLLFLFCRQAVTFTLARATEAFVIDFLALQTMFWVRVAGPLFTLFLVRSKGYPSTIFFWGLYDLILLYGKTKFAKHW